MKIFILFYRVAVAVAVLTNKNKNQFKIKKKWNFACKTTIWQVEYINSNINNCTLISALGYFVKFAYNFVVSYSDICIDILWPYTMCNVHHSILYTMFLSIECFFFCSYFSFAFLPLLFHTHNLFHPSFIHSFIWSLAFKCRQPLSNAKQINNNLFVTNDCYFTHLNNICMYIHDARHIFACIFIFIHKPKSFVKCISFCIDACKSHSFVRYISTNKTNSFRNEHSTP